MVLSKVSSGVVKRRPEVKKTPTDLGGGYTYSDLLTLLPSKSPIAASVPRPRPPPLVESLPLWRTKPLDAKLPLMPGPHGPVVFTRAKLGEELWKDVPGREFQLSGKVGEYFAYDALHDHLLRAWLRRPDTVAFLRRQGLVTPSPRLEPTCTVDQYNRFRQYLYTLYSDALHKEVQNRENQIKERLLVNKACHNAEKEVAKLKKLEDSNAKRMSNVQKLEQLNIERLEKCKKRLQRVIDQAKRAEFKKEAKLDDLKQRMKAFDDRIKSRIITANNLERKKKIKAMKAWHKQNVEKKKKFEKRKIQRELENKQKAEARWHRKVEEQNKQIAKEMYLREQKTLSKERYIEQYMDRMEKAWAKLQEEKSSRKSREVTEKLKYEKRKKITKQIMFSVSEAYIREKKSIGYLSQDQETIAILTEHAKQTLKEIRYDLEPYIVIAHAKGRLERQENVPLPVSGAITLLLDQTIVEYTARQLSHTMTTAANKVLTAIDDLKEQSSGDQISTGKKKSFGAFSKRMSSSSEKTARISEVEIIPFHKMSEELSVDVGNLRRTRERPPTPMPSITTFTDIVFKQSPREEFEDDYYGEYAFIEQENLKICIAEVSKRIYKMIPSRVRAVVRSLSYDRISIADSEGAAIPENKPLAKLCSIMLFESSIQDPILTRIVDQIILKFMQSINMTPSYLRLKVRQFQEK